MGAGRWVGCGGGGWGVGMFGGEEGGKERVAGAAVGLGRGLGGRD